MRLGRAALEQGQMAAARAAWQAAGHWAELLPLCALQADLATLRTLLASVCPTLQSYSSAQKGLMYSLHTLLASVRTVQCLCDSLGGKQYNALHQGVLLATVCSVLCLPGTLLATLRTLLASVRPTRHTIHDQT